jgi:hypothetical protein
MESALNVILQALMGGGPGAIIALLVAFIGLLCWHIRQLSKDVEKKDTKIEKILDDYHKGNLTLTEALTSLKMVLVEIKAKL